MYQFTLLLWIELGVELPSDSDSAPADIEMTKTKNNAHIITIFRSHIITIFLGKHSIIVNY